MEVQMEKVLITIPQVAVYLSVSIRKCWQMRDAGMLPGVVNIGRSVRVNREVLAEWVRNGCPDCRKAKR